MITSLTLDLSALKPSQRQELLALVESFHEPYYIPTSEETAEHAAPTEQGRRY